MLRAPTKAEMLVWREVVKGYKLRTIAQLLNKSPKTVDAQLCSLRLKLGVSSTPELAVEGRRRGLLERDIKCDE